MQLVKPDPQSVFLNVPFDIYYEKVFVALITALISLGRVPHCVLEISDTGQGRMSRIMRLISKCQISIHDLSRVGVPVRFNMPFELGIAYAFRSIGGKLGFLLMEKKEHSLDKTLSDLKFIEALIHKGRPLIAIRAIYEALSRPRGNPPIHIAENIFRQLWVNIGTIRHRRRDIFNRLSFNELIVGATKLAQEEGLIP